MCVHVGACMFIQPKLELTHKQLGGEGPLPPLASDPLSLTKKLGCVCMCIYMSTS